ncbi:DUF2690 domain-containing protein [Streptomyces sp. NPDC048558]|uniref:DUF2690 domain-containing protein n=1 Tax=Streptomyces sp. NPDC048558 TaxID=3155759 RepID=UPI0033DA8028
MAALVTMMSLGLPAVSATPAAAAPGCAPLQSGASAAAQAAVEVACPAVLKDVPSCGDYPEIGGTMAGAENNTSCGDGTDPNSAGAWTAKSTTVFGRAVELRYSSTTQCAWGRIIGGTVGDEICVDRSADGGETWNSMLGFTTITSGNDAYTTQWNDAGLVMRACGTNGPGGGIECTGWF